LTSWSLWTEMHTNCMLRYFMLNITFWGKSMLNITHHHSHVRFVIHKSHIAANHLVVLTWD
jgi:hypothetical protein